MSSDGEMRRHAVSKWLQDQGIRNPEMISSAEHAELLTLLAPHKGFGIFWSMLMFERQNAAIQLANSSLATPEGVARAAQMQGFIKSVDAWRELLLNIADPFSDDAASEQRAGEI